MNGPRLRVLLVEDDPDISDAIRRLLQGHNIDCDWVPDGDQGYDALVSPDADYDIAVVDVLMPGRNGFSLCRDLRAAGVPTPILVLTAKTGAYDEAEALDLGADDFMTKPFEPVVLIARLIALSRRGSSAIWDRPEPAIHLDERAGTLTYGAQTAKLSPRETQLAAAILAGGGTPVPKDTLVQRVWNGRGDANTVEVYVGYLRRRLADTFGDRLRIETERRQGYRFRTS